MLQHCKYLNKNLKILLSSIIVLSYVSTTLSQSKVEISACKSPNNETGLCLHITDCSYLFNMLQSSNLTTQDKDFLAKSQCGYDTAEEVPARKVLVCCIKKYNSTVSGNQVFPPENTAVPGNQVVHVNQANPENQMISPNNGSLAAVTPAGNILPKVGVCGKTLGSRILGGNETRIDEFPWMALIEYKKPQNIRSHHCGGSLINSRYVLTAAHCVNGSQIPKTWELSRVRLGEWNLTSDPDCEVDSRGKQDCAMPHLDVDVVGNITHPSYIPDSRDQLNDIALLRLADKVAYTDFINPICLPLSSELRIKDFQDYVMDVAGWGQTSRFSTRGSLVKLKILVKVWSLKACQEKYSTFENVLNEMQICAGGDENIDTCRGDSGGPLMVQENMGGHDIYFIAGVVSYGPTPCGLLGWPGVYTKVGSYIDWIQANLQA